MAQLNKGTTYSTGDQVTAANLNALVDNATILPGAITEQLAASSLTTADSTLLSQPLGLRKTTLGQILSLVPSPDLTPYLKADGSVAMTTGQQLTLGSTTQIASLDAVSLGHLQNNYLKRDGSVSMTGQLNLPNTSQSSSLNAVSLGYLQSNYRSSSIVAWVNFDGQKNTSGTLDTGNTNRLIRTSYNVSSISKTSGGCYVVNFSSPLVDANYLIMGNTSYGNQLAGFATHSLFANGTTGYAFQAPTTSSCAVGSWNTGGGPFSDAQYVYVVIIR